VGRSEALEGMHASDGTKRIAAVACKRSEYGIDRGSAVLQFQRFIKHSLQFVPFP